MKLRALGEAVDATSVANQTAVDFTDFTTPFMPGRKVVAVISPLSILSGNAATAATSKVQGSDDGVTYVDLLTCAAGAGKMAEVTLYNYMRFGVTVAAGSASTLNAYLLADSV